MNGWDEVPDDSTLRGFGLTAGAVLASMGLWWLFRGRLGAAWLVFIGIGALLILCGAVFPRLLAWLYRGWMAVGEALSFIATRVILFLVFALIVTPIGVLRRLKGADPLRRRSLLTESSWHTYPERHLDPKHYEKGY